MIRNLEAMENKSAMMVKVRLLGGPCDGYDDELRHPVNPVNLYQAISPDGRKETHAYEWAHFSCAKGARWVLKHKCRVGEGPLDLDSVRLRNRAKRIGLLSNREWTQAQLEHLADGGEVEVGKARYAACPDCCKVVRTNKPVLGGLHYCSK